MLQFTIQCANYAHNSPYIDYMPTFNATFETKIIKYLKYLYNQHFFYFGTFSVSRVLIKIRSLLLLKADFP